jgi:hypothetical protein
MCPRYKDVSKCFVFLQPWLLPYYFISRQKFSTMQFLKSSVLLVLALAMHASAQDCIQAGELCQYGTSIVGPCCPDLSCVLDESGSYMGTVNIFLLFLYGGI